jgi:hypothetical protein
MTTEKNSVPTITSVRDSQGVEIPNGGATPSSNLQLSGFASAGDRVEIIDNNVVKGQILANATGAWLFYLMGLSVGGHSISAKGQAGISAPRTFSVVAGK